MLDLCLGKPKTHDTLFVRVRHWPRSAFGPIPRLVYLKVTRVRSRRQRGRGRRAGRVVHLVPDAKAVQHPVLGRHPALVHVLEEEAHDLLGIVDHKADVVPLFPRQPEHPANFAMPIGYPRHDAHANERAGKDDATFLSRAPLL